MITLFVTVVKFQEKVGTGICVVVGMVAFTVVVGAGVFVGADVDGAKRNTINLT